MAQLIVTAVGADRPGLVGELAGKLHEMGANIIDTRMVNLRGQFAVLVLLEAEPAPAATIKSSANRLAEDTRLRISVVDHTSSVAATQGLPFKLKTYSMDQPGLVAKIADVLRRHHVNIEELTARQESAPFAGSLLFTLEARLTVPANVPVRTLRSELQAVCDKLNCDLDLEPA